MLSPSDDSGGKLSKFWSAVARGRLLWWCEERKAGRIGEQKEGGERRRGERSEKGTQEMIDEQKNRAGDENRTERGRREQRIRVWREENRRLGVSDTPI